MRLFTILKLDVLFEDEVNWTKNEGKRALLNNNYFTFQQKCENIHDATYNKPTLHGS